MKGFSKKVSSSFLIFILVLTMPLTALAHSGRTDSSGGHRDNKNKSGLGSYHYHCGGYPAHLHDGGVCPYTYDNNSYTSNSSASPTVTKSPTPQYSVETSTFVIKNNTDYFDTIVSNNITLVELRSISEALSISPEYRKDSNSILIDKMDGHKVVFFVNSNKVINSNGETIKLDTKPIIHNNKTYVPIRALVENLGLILNYDNGIYYIS